MEFLDLAGIGSALSGFLAPIVAKYPLMMTVVFFMGALRVVMKPLISVLRAYVVFTPNPTDDAVLDSIEQSKWMKGLIFAVDYIASIKPLK
jgi:hypothetical protein